MNSEGYDSNFDEQRGRIWSPEISSYNEIKQFAWMQYFVYAVYSTGKKNCLKFVKKKTKLFYWLWRREERKNGLNDAPDNTT